ncbi:hypothetical protein [Chitinophaga agri]|uniref:Uncharacterized protein n=1 Tax=Chitinophaga agri TaxID=2703787 RepID=A0A6B9Z965_9BACT|nr:hypothetical protein [Chitinophaga agri]QHS58790.1 hypothetical protein GWR21_03975 [Chitinophaga agri]
MVTIKIGDQAPFGTSETRVEASQLCAGGAAVTRCQIWHAADTLPREWANRYIYGNTRLSLYQMPGR